MHTRYSAYMTFDASATYSYFPSLFLSLDALYPDSHFHSFTCNNYLKFVSLDGLACLDVCRLAIINIFRDLCFHLTAYCLDMFTRHLPLLDDTIPMYLLLICFAWILGFNWRAYLRACCAWIFAWSYREAKNKQLDKLDGVIHRIRRLRC